MGYAALIDNPKPVVERIAAFADLAWDGTVEERLARPLPPSHMTVSSPAPEKWRKRAGELASVRWRTEAVARAVAALAGPPY